MKKINLPKKELKRMYLTKRMTTLEISKFYGCNEETVRNYLIEYGIKRRRDAPRFIKSVKKLTRLQASYFAGIVDGEGTITIAKSTRSIGGLTPLFSVANTDKKLIDWLMKNVGGKVTASQPKNKKWKIKYRWYSYTIVDVCALINMVYPYLIIKKENAKRVLKFCKWRMKLAGESYKKEAVYSRRPDGRFAKSKKINYRGENNGI